MLPLTLKYPLITCQLLSLFRSSVGWGTVSHGKPLIDNYLYLPKVPVPSQGTYCVQTYYQSNSTGTFDTQAKLSMRHSPTHKPRYQCVRIIVLHYNNTQAMLSMC